MRERFLEGQTLESYIDSAQRNQEFWRGVYRNARVAADLLPRVAAVTGRWNLLVLSEDWCGDAVNSVPVIVRLAESIAECECRIVSRDANPDLMNSHLTTGTRSIPVVMVLDDTYQEKGWWGPRPAELQRWFLTEGFRMEKPDRSRQMREWYARDRGRSAQAEVLAIIEAALAAQ